MTTARASALDAKTKKEVLRYSVVTPLVGLTDFGTYFLALKFMPVSPAKGLAFFIAAVVGYLINKYWTFAKQGRSVTEAARYGAVQAGVLVFNVAVNKGLLLAFPGALVPAMVAASILSAVLSFICKKWLVFR